MIKVNWRWYPYKPLGKMPHMLMKDSLILNNFIKDNPTAFDEMTFDVTVGSGRDLIGIYPENYLKDWKYLSSLKVDVIFKKANELTVCEVKPILLSNAVGQVEVYSWFLNIMLLDTVKLNKAILGASVHPDVEIYAKAHGITVLLAKSIEIENLPVEPLTRQAGKNLSNGGSMGEISQGEQSSEVKTRPPTLTVPKTKPLVVGGSTGRIFGRSKLSTEVGKTIIVGGEGSKVEGSEGSKV